MEAVRVGVRIRPLSSAEKARGDKDITKVDGHQLKIHFGDGREKTFTCDYEPFVCSEGADHDRADTTDKITTVNKTIGDFIISNAFKGFHSAVYSYGCRESGKSYAMFGNGKQVEGLVQKVVKDIFSKAETYDETTTFRMELSYFELCGDNITDLISKRSSIKSSDGIPKLKVREHPDTGVYVDKLSKHIVTDLMEANSLLEKGSKSRRRLAALDPVSRGHSHAIFSLVLTQAKLQESLPYELISKIMLIDLASQDKRVDVPTVDPNQINDDVHQTGPLETLNDVIASLAAQNYGGFNSSSKWGNPVVPYKESVLTWLMKDSLGGNCNTIMLCCISPSSRVLQDTLNSLKHASLARNIINMPVLNEDSNVKLIRELKEEIDHLKNQGGNKLKVPSNGPLSDTQRKLQKDEELMQRLTGIWEEKWSQTQKMMEDKSLAVTDYGTAVKLESKEPHFVSLGGGRLSIGVSIIPVKIGTTTVGISSDVYKPDLEVRGKGIVNEHCVIEYDGDAVVLHPKNELVAIDGIPISEPTKLPQGCMVCLGRNNYFRFNHPKEAARIKASHTSGRFSIVPDGFYPDVQLAIEQRRKEMQEKGRLKAENKRLLALEQQYLQSQERLEFEKQSLEQEKRKLQVLQQQQHNIANQFDRKIAIQIKELELKRQELKRYEVEKEQLMQKEKDIEMANRKLAANRNKQETIKAKYDQIQSEQAKIELDEFEKLEQVLSEEEDEEGVPRKRTHSVAGRVETDRLHKELELETDRQRLAMEELDNLEEDLLLQELYRQQKVEIENEKKRLEEMEELHQRLEADLSVQIDRLQKERENELDKINKEKERLKRLEKKQLFALSQIEAERGRLEEEKESEKMKMVEERERELEIEKGRLSALERAVKEQERERDLINAEKQRLFDLEYVHRTALKELELNKISQQEKLERERQLELEYIETEQLMLEELEHKQFESARQMEYEAQLLRDQVQKEKEDELRKLDANRKHVQKLAEKHEEALLLAEEERVKLKEIREKEQEQLHLEREKLSMMENEYKVWIVKVEDEKKALKEEYEKQKQDEIEKFKDEFKRSASLPRTFKKLPNVDPALLRRCKTPEDKMKQIEEERQRLGDLKKLAAEKAEIEWNSKKQELERRESEEKELTQKRKMLEEMKKEQERSAESDRLMMQEESDKIKQHEEWLMQKEKELEDLKKEKQRREELEQQLQQEKHVEDLLEQSLTEEKQKLKALEMTLSEERLKRIEIEKILEEKQKVEEEEKNKVVLVEDKKQHRLGSKRSSTSEMRFQDYHEMKYQDYHEIKRRIPSYTPSIRSFPGALMNDTEINLLQHIVAAGHIIENCPSVKLNRYSCRGYLSKMGKSRIRTSWKKRWFVFDRKLRALCYYHDERRTKAKGVVYFQAIQEVYVDSSIKRSPNQKTTFCVKTPQRTFILSAPSPISMSIWIDVICTGREGAMC